MYRNTSHLASKSGEGSASWSDFLNAGLMSQRDHTFKATARDSKGIIDTSTETITIDNTPKVSVSAGKPDGDMNVTGTVDFKANIIGNEDFFALYIKEIGASSYTKQGATKSFEGKKISWKYSDFTGARLQKSVWGQKEILVKAVAAAANGASASVAKGVAPPALGCPITFNN